MKQQIVPTSPKSQHASERRSGSVFIAILFSVIFGTLSGLFGLLIGLNLFSYLSDSNSLDRVFFSSTRSEQSVITQSPEVTDQIASVYADEPSIEQPAAWLGNAVALTDDGWFIVPTVSLQNVEAGKSPVLELSTGETARVTESVDDPFTGMTFIHVDAEPLSVVTFPDTKHLTSGQAVSVVTVQHGEPILYERLVSGTPFSDRTQTLDSLTHLPLLDTQNAAQLAGAPVFYSNGNLAGIMLQDTRILPSQWLQGVLQDVLRSQTVSRTSLRIESVNSDRLTSQERTSLGIPEHGLYIVAGDGTIQTGDVITVMNGVRVEATTNLQDIVHSKAVGTTLYMTVIRAGEDQAIELLL